MLPDRSVGSAAELDFRRGADRPFGGRPSAVRPTLLAMDEKVAANGNGLPEATRVRRWRRSQFVALGFTPTEASLLTKAAVDLGEVRRLVASGCPLEIARRIVL